MASFVRRPQFEDALRESYQTWGVKLPDRYYMNLWEGWQPIGFNGPIPILNDPGQEARELSEAARDLKIQQTAHEQGVSSTEVRQNMDAQETE